MDITIGISTLLIIGSIGFLIYELMKDDDE